MGQKSFPPLDTRVLQSKITLDSKTIFLLDQLRSHLDEMVDHEGADAGPPPLRMHQQEGDVGLVVLDVRHHETEANHHLLVEDDHAEVWVLQTLGKVHACSETPRVVNLRVCVCMCLCMYLCVSERSPGQKLS